MKIDTLIQDQEDAKLSKYDFEIQWTLQTYWSVKPVHERGVTKSKKTGEQRSDYLRHRNVILSKIYIEFLQAASFFFLVPFFLSVRFELLLHKCRCFHRLKGSICPYMKVESLIQWKVYLLKHGVRVSCEVVSFCNQENSLSLSYRERSSRFTPTLGSSNIIDRDWGNGYNLFLPLLSWLINSFVILYHDHF